MLDSILYGMYLGTYLPMRNSYLHHDGFHFQHWVESFVARSVLGNADGGASMTVSVSSSKSSSLNFYYVAAIVAAIHQRWERV